MDADGGNVRQLTETPNASEHDAAWSPDGRHVAYDRAAITADGTRRNAQLWIIDADGSNARALTSGSSRNMRPAWSPDGSIIAFMSDRHAEFDINVMGTDDGDLEIYVMKRDSSNTRRLTECAGAASGPAWSPDGQRIAYNCNPYSHALHFEQLEICVIRADGSEFRTLTQNEVFDGHPDWW